ncbi:MAG TPA: hypothetical protein VLZ03_13395 [Thermodesulfobacteriota bacterium]|nr:hypothetical protein [Thermodesulfobacteriota bacterium]
MLPRGVQGAARFSVVNPEEGILAERLRKITGHGTSSREDERETVVRKEE